MKQYVIAMIVLAMAGPLAASEFDLPPGKWWENEKLAEHIGLTDDQTGEISELVYAHARRMIDLKAKVELAGLDLAETVNRADFDAGAVRAAYTDFQEARGALEHERFEMLLAVRQVLTFEQWQELQGLKRRFGDARDRRSGPPSGQRRPGMEGGQRPPGQRF